MKRIRRSPHGERGLKCALRGECLSKAGSRSPHGERGLKCVFCRYCVRLFSRSPHGERGLKSAWRASHGRLRDVALLMESVD